MIGWDQIMNAFTIKLPKVILKDPNALDASSRKGAGPMKDKRKKRLKEKLRQLMNEHNQ